MAEPMGKVWEFSVDVKTPGTIQPFRAVREDNTNVFIIHVNDDSVPMDLGGMRVSIVYAAPKGLYTQDETNGVTVTDPANGIVRIDVNTGKLSSGMVTAELQIVSGDAMDKQTTTSQFKFSCRPAILSSETIQELNEFPPLLYLIDRVEGLVDDVQNIGDYANSQGDYAKRMGDYAKESGDYARESGEYAIAMGNAVTSATIEVGNIETLNPNQKAYVVNVGTKKEAVFDIGIPQGAPGTGNVTSVNGQYGPDVNLRAEHIPFLPPQGMNAINTQTAIEELYREGTEGMGQSVEEIIEAINSLGDKIDEIKPSIGGAVQGFRNTLYATGIWISPVTGKIRIFEVGGGAGGYLWSSGSPSYIQAAAVGGGGYTKTYELEVVQGESVPYIIGAGGLAGKDGNFTQFKNENYRAEGGKIGFNSGTTAQTMRNGEGGSAGGAWDGGDGANGVKGQGYTTRPFGRIDEWPPYSPGGNAPYPAPFRTSPDSPFDAINTRAYGAPNTGAGGAYNSTYYSSNGSTSYVMAPGGSGIIIIEYGIEM